MDRYHGRGASVSLSGLEKSYDRVGAVNGVSLDIRSGEFLTLLGPSGSGKTTTLDDDRGLRDADRRRHRDRRHVRRCHAAAQAQHRHGVPELRAVPASDGGGEHRLPAETARRDQGRRARKLVGEALDLVQLPGYGGRYPRQLSGGQQQRVALARAIVFKPRLLLMDEPLGALDKQLRENLQLEMRRLHADLGITFIYVTHDQEEALTMSDRIAVMNEGLVAQVGSPGGSLRPAVRSLRRRLHRRVRISCRRRSCGMEGDVVVAECEGAVVRALCATPPARGQKVTLTTRPERIRFADGHDGVTMVQHGALNRMSVTVTEAVFAGERCRYMLQAADGTAMVLKEPSSAAIRRRVRRRAGRNRLVRRGHDSCLRSRNRRRSAVPARSWLAFGLRLAADACRCCWWHPS